VINDLAITKDAVYFTDFAQPFLYRLPLSRNGGLPGAGAATTIPLTGEFGDGVSNGIVATPDGKTLIINDSFRSKLFRVDPTTGIAKEIVIEPALDGFLDGMILQGKTLYIVTPYDFVPDPVDRIQVLQLSDDLLSAKRVQTITDGAFDGVASGAIFGNSLYVNNARYFDLPEPATAYWFTKVTIRPKK
jgi:sugar lactone lactonase YvrE